MRSLSALGTLGVAASLVAANGARSPPVKVSLTTSWAAPPLLLEIMSVIILFMRLETTDWDFSETAAAEHLGQYFDIVDALADRSSAGLLGPITDPLHKPQYIYNTALPLLQARGFLTEPNALSTFEKSLALHLATPKIQAFYQIVGSARPSHCDSWIEWAGKQACTTEDADNILKERTDITTTHVFPFDHVQKQANEECTSPAIFYASLSSENFNDLYSYLRSKSTQPGFCFIMRYAPPKDAKISGEHDRNTLSGYGVALDLKVCYSTVYYRD